MAYNFSDLSTIVSTAGPFKSSAGNFYLIGADSSSNLYVWSTSDPTNWGTKLYSGINSNVQYISAYQVNDVLHVAYSTSSSASATSYFYNTFNMSTNSWGPSNETIYGGADTRDSSLNAQYGISIAVRSDGSVVVLFNGPRTASMGTSYSRVVYNSRSSSGTWGTTTAVGSASTTNEKLPECVLGTSDIVHCFWSQNNVLSHRSLTSANSLQTANTSGTTISSSVVNLSAISVNISGTQTIYVFVHNSSGTIVGWKFASANVPTYSSISFGTNTLNPIAFSNTGSLNIYVLGASSPAGSVYKYTSTDGTNWSSANTIQSGTFFNNFSIDAKTTYQSGSNIVIPYIVNDNGTVKYNENVLASLGSVGVATGSATISGVGGKIVSAVGSASGTSSANAVGAFTNYQIGSFGYYNVQQLNASSNANWTSLTTSNDGKLLSVNNQNLKYVRYNGSNYIAGTLSISGGKVYCTTSANDWSHVFLISAASDDSAVYVYHSTNGSSWQLQATNNNLVHTVAMASSADGSRIVASVYGGYIYTSTDYGVTWTQTGAVSANWVQNCLAISDDGTKIVAGLENNYIYLSTDSGATWNPLTGPGGHWWTGLSMTGDGTKIFATNWDGADHAYLLTYSGSSWTTTTIDVTTTGNNLTGCCISDDGKKIFVVDQLTSSVYSSVDSGVTWQKTLNANTQVDALIPFAITGDGTKAYQGSGLSNYLNIFTTNNGTSKVTAIGQALNIAVGVGSSTGTSSVSGIGSAISGGVATSNGSAVISGSAAAISSSVGTSSPILPGYTLTPQTNSGLSNWYRIAASANTQYVYAYTIASPSGIYRSTDYGVTWNSFKQVNNVNDISTSSLNGQYIVAGINSQNILTSNDYGVTWTSQTNSGSKNWTGVGIDGYGSRMIAAAFNDYIYTSNDYGVTWTQQTGAGSRAWRAVASDSTGQYLAAVADVTQIYTSNDYGVTWNPQASTSRYWNAIASSFTGQYLVAVDSNYVFYSKDYGVTWNSKYLGVIRDVTVSLNGSKIVAVTSDSIYLSNDFGLSWYSQQFSGLYASIGASSDGSKVVIASYNNDYIYTGNYHDGSVQALATGAAIIARVANSNGTATVQAIGVPLTIQAVIGSANGIASVSATGSSISQSTASSTGTSSVSGTGASIYSSASFVTGQSTTTAVGASTVASIAFSAGSSSVLSTTLAINSRNAIITGTSTVNGVGNYIVSSIGNAAGTSVVNGGLSTLTSAIASASGISAVNATGRSFASVTAISAGTSIVSGVGHSTATTTANALGTSIVSGIGRSTFVTIGNANGTSIVVGNITSIQSLIATSIGTSFVNGVGATASTSIAISNGTSSVSGTAISTAAAQGISIGTSTATGFFEIVAISIGTSFVNGVGGSIASATATTNGVASVSGNTFATADFIGEIDGTSAANAEGISTVEAVGTATGSATVSARGGLFVSVTGVATGVSNVNGKLAATAETTGNCEGISTTEAIGSPVFESIGSITSNAIVSGFGAEFLFHYGVGISSGTAYVIGRSEYAKIPIQNITTHLSVPRCETTLSKPYVDISMKATAPRCETVVAMPSIKINMKVSQTRTIVESR